MLLVNSLILESTGILFHNRPGFTCFKNKVLSIVASHSLLSQSLFVAVKKQHRSCPKPSAYSILFSFFC